MNSLIYIYFSIVILSTYLIVLLRQSKYRLVLPSTINTSVWLITTLLILCQLKGFLVSKTLPDSAFIYSSQFILAISISSVIGFTIAHAFSDSSISDKELTLVDYEVIDNVLQKFKWIPYLCGIVGVTLFVFIITTIGSFDAFSDYRIMAISMKRVGYAAIAQRLSGHISILGSFYLMLLGYKYGQTGIDMKKFFLTVFLCSTINMSIGGRVWLMSSTLPFLSTYIFSYKYSDFNIDIKRNDLKKLAIIILVFTVLFSILGTLRNTTLHHNFWDKFLYFTDGSRMTNMVMMQYPENTYELEYGKATMLQGIVSSPMINNFAKSISDNIGLSVTVKSIMPNLYYDFGILGGAIFWGILCLVIEYCCIRMKYNNTVFGIILFGQLSILLFQSPVGNVFSLNLPSFEWLLIIYLFRKRLFGNCIDEELNLTNNPNCDNQSDYI